MSCVPQNFVSGIIVVVKLNKDWRARHRYSFFLHDILLHRHSTIYGRCHIERMIAWTLPANRSFRMTTAEIFSEALLWHATHSYMTLHELLMKISHEKLICFRIMISENGNHGHMFESCHT